jgi:hypothetical protein
VFQSLKPQKKLNTYTITHFDGIVYVIEQGPVQKEELLNAGEVLFCNIRDMFIKSYLITNDLTTADVVQS